ncbi:MAG: diacylglycerol kinase [Burkholderiaceae bacterium]
MNPAQNPFKSRGGPGRLLNATRYSLSGLRWAWKHEAAFRQELALLCAGVAAVWWLELPRGQALVLIGSLVFVLIVELLNSAIEAIVDLVAPEAHPLAAAAKDLGSAAVMTSLGLAGAIWVITLI